MLNNNYDVLKKKYPKIDRDVLVRNILLNYTNRPLKQVPNVVLFDMSNTLVDSKKIEREALNYVLLKYGKDTWENGTRNKKDPKKSIKQNFPNFFGDKWKEAYELYINYMLKYKDKTPLIDGARELLEYLHKNNIYTVVVSNRDSNFTNELLKYHKIDHLITYIVGADNTSYTKPNPKMIQIPLSKLNIEDKDPYIIFIGDALVDVQCADNYGCQPILITKHITDIDQKFILNRIRSDHQQKYDLKVVLNHHEIKDLIKNKIITQNNKYLQKEKKNNLTTLYR